jgi:diadenosine tetraphosphate (Ap4A) HIT family hydrolase
MTFSKLNHTNVRTDEQKERMSLAEEKKICPFCPNGLDIIHQKEILFKNDSWYFTESAFPYEGTKHHYLINTIKHITDTNELNSKEWSDFGEIFNFALASKKIDGGAIFLRFGDMSKNGSSVEHIHFQLISGEMNESNSKDERESLKVKLGYKKKTI